METSAEHKRNVPEYSILENFHNTGKWITYAGELNTKGSATFYVPFLLLSVAINNNRDIGSDDKPASNAANRRL